MARTVLLVIEDGSGVSGANSFATEDEIVTFGASRGVTIPNTSDAEKDAVAINAIIAMDYLSTLAWAGYPVTFEQPLPFPRTGLYVNPNDVYEEYPSDAIPSAVKTAQMRLAIEVFNGVDLLPTGVSGAPVIREKVGQLETEYASPQYFRSSPSFLAIDAMLQPYLTVGGSSRLRLTNVRT